MHLVPLPFLPADAPIRFSPDGGLAAVTGLSYDTVAIIDLTTGTLVKQLYSDWPSFSHVAIGPNGRELFSTDDEGWLTRRDLRTGNTLERVQLANGPHQSYASTKAFPLCDDPEGGRVWIANWHTLWTDRSGPRPRYQWRLAWYDADDACAMALGTPPMRPIVKLRSLGKNRLLIRCDNTVISPHEFFIWNTGTREREATFAEAEHFAHFDVHRELPFAAYGETRRLRLHDWSRGEDVASANVHRRRITGLAFSPFVDELVTCGQEGLVKLWSLPDLQPLEEWDWGRGALRSIGYTPDGLRLAVLADRSLVVWDANPFAE